MAKNLQNYSVRCNLKYSVSYLTLQANCIAACLIKNPTNNTGPEIHTKAESVFVIIK